MLIHFHSIFPFISFHFILIPFLLPFLFDLIILSFILFLISPLFFSSSYYKLLLPLLLHPCYSFPFLQDLCLLYIYILLFRIFLLHQILSYLYSAPLIVILLA